MALLSALLLLAKQRQGLLHGLVLIMPIDDF